MNILFFLSPKQDLMYVYDDFTLRQTLEKWENNRYASIPVLNRQGKYVGTLTEGDILWGLKKFHGLDLEAAEDVPISAFPHKRDYKAVTVTTSMDQLIEAAMNQNFVPVVDDRGIFIATPDSVELSGDFQDILSAGVSSGVDMSSLNIHL